MTQTKRNSIIVLSVVFGILLILAVTIATFAVMSEKELAKAETLYENLAEKYGKSENIFYTDGDTIFIGNSEIRCDQITQYRVMPLYVTNDAVYFLDKNLSDGVRSYYKADHTFSVVQKIYSHKDGNVVTAFMPNENELYYTDADGIPCVYYLNENKSEPYSGTSIWDAKTKNDMYSVKEIESGILTQKSSFTVTHQQTGKHITLDIGMDSLHRVDILSKLDQELGLSLRQVWCECDTIYVQCQAASIITTLEYNIETDTFTYLDIVHIIDNDSYQTFIN